MEFENLHQVLRSLYDEMMPLCADMAGVAKGIAGLGALFYVAYRVWQSLARAEPIDVFPMLRPFVIGFCIMFFPSIVLGTINSVMSPIVQGTNRMLEGQTLDMNKYREQKDKLEYEAMMRNPETAYLVSNEEFDKQLEEIMLIGLIAKTAILLTEYAVERRRAGMGITEAALSAAKARLRPILMTALTMIVGMLPLMAAHGVGANGNRSLGSGVVGGLLPAREP